MFRKFLKISFIILFAFCLLSVLWVFSYKYFNPPVSTLMLYKYFNKKEYKIQKTWVDLEDVDQGLPIALIASEDQLFLNHNGFDINAIKNAIKKNKTSKNKIGASTISQQVAKNIFLIPTKSMFRKGLEAYFTVLIEGIWGKRRIMEVYINIIEFGDGIYGVDAAAQKFFNKSATEINLNEATLMAVSLPNPILFDLGNPSQYMFRRKNWVLNQVKNLGGEKIISHWYD
jgi:monofunctional biosynthetic peptidoglycan transglycosylase